MYGVGLDTEVSRINMKLQMAISKKNDGLSLRNLLGVLKSFDKANCGDMDMDTFTKATRQYG